MIARFCCKLESQKPKMPECCPFDAILAQAQEKVSARWGRVSAAMLTLARRIRLGAPRPMVRAYHETVHDHFHNPRNVGSLDKNDPKVPSSAYVSTNGVFQSIHVGDPFGGSFSAVSKPNLASKNIRRKALDEVYMFPSHWGEVLLRQNQVGRAA